MSDKSLIDYFMEQTNKRFDRFEEKFDKFEGKFESKLNSLLRFKWQIVSGALTVTFIVTVLFQVILFFK